MVVFAVRYFLGMSNQQCLLEGKQMWEKFNQKPYFELKEEYKILLGLESRTSDWQWFIDCVETTFWMKDIERYKTYTDLVISYRRIYEKFYLINRECNPVFTIKEPLVMDFNTLSLFALHRISSKECISRLKTNACKYLMIEVWITKYVLVNDYLHELVMPHFLQEYHFWRKLNSKTFCKVKKDFIDYVNSLDLPGFDEDKNFILFGMKFLPDEIKNPDKIRICFLSEDDSCTTVMACAIFRSLIKKMKIEDDFYFESMALLDTMLEEPIDENALALLRKHKHYSKDYYPSSFKRDYYNDFDYFVCMTMQDTLLFLGRMDRDMAGKMKLLQMFCGKIDAVADPRITGDYEASYAQIKKGLTAMLNSLGYRPVGKIKT